MSDAAVLPQKEKKSRKGLIIGAIIAVIAIVAAIVGVVISSATPAKTVKIGVTDLQEPYWKTFTKIAKDKYGINVKLTNFTDYSKPNPATAQSQLDLNQFQHIQYLADYNVTNNDDLQPIASTAVYPLPLYSLKYKSVSALPANSTVVIANDPINEARGLLVLQSAGLITLKDGGSPFSSTKDILTHKVKVVAINANQTAQNLQNGSAQAAIVNNNYAAAADLGADQVIAKDDPSDPSALAYVNVLVAKKADVNNETYINLGKIYKDKEFTAAFKKSYPASSKVQYSAEKLQSILKTTEAQAKAAK